MSYRVMQKADAVEQGVECYEGDQWEQLEDAEAAYLEWDGWLVYWEECA